MSPFGLAWYSFVRSADSNCRLRLAPTPSGYLHLGNALNFLLNWATARYHNGHLFLRIDDLDAARKRPEYVQDVFYSLQWLGIEWDEGPKSVADFEKNWSQHLRLPLYYKQLDKLRSTGLLFACNKSRRDLAPFEGHYPERFREQGLALDDAGVSWRIATPPGFPMPDFVVRRRDGLPAYQIASMVDDVHFGITHAVRGTDLEPSTQAQQWLASLVDDNRFLDISFFHHPLLLDESGNKLSKSAGSESLLDMQRHDILPVKVFQQCAILLGSSPDETKTPQDLLHFLETP